MEVTVTFESLPGYSAHGLNRPQFGFAGSPEMDRLHRHRSIMHQPPVEEALLSSGDTITLRGTDGSHLLMHENVHNLVKANGINLFVDQGFVHVNC